MGIDGLGPPHHGLSNHASLLLLQVERVARSLPQLLLRWRPSEVFGGGRLLSVSTQALLTRTKITDAPACGKMYSDPLRDLLNLRVICIATDALPKVPPVLSRG